MKALIIERFPPRSENLHDRLVHLQIAGGLKVDVCTTFAEANALLKNGTYEFYFFGMAQEKPNPLESLRILRSMVGNSTIFAVFDQPVQELDIAALRAGADDCLFLNDPDDNKLKNALLYGREREVLRTKFHEATLESQTAERVKSAFLANMSHEIRTPLNLIIGAADLLKDTLLSPQQKKLVETFATAGDHLLTLLSGILDVTQVEAGGLHCRDAEFDPNEVFVEACDIVSVLCRSKRLEFEYLLGSRIPSTCVGDKLRIRQVLLNLLNNAIKFTPTGKVRLYMEALESDGHKINLRITVKDTGIGISEENLKRLFVNFHQADSGLERKFGGIGLGLSIVKAIAGHYHGSVDIRSKPGQGTEVQVDLCLALRGDKNAEPPRFELNGEKILIVTHSELEGQTIAHQLQLHGAQTGQTTSGEEAIRALGPETSFTHAILDVRSSDLGLFELLKHPDFVFPRERITILLPPLHRKNDVEDCAALGVYRYVHKAFSAQKFLQVVRRDPKLDQPPEPPQKPRPLHILVVDDDMDNRQLIEAYLKPTPHHVTFASGGREALDIAAKRIFDLVLMDIEMPGLNGYETGRRLLALETGRFSKILGLSANAFPENVEMARRSGFAGYVTKPIRKKDLLRSIEECVRSEIFFDALAAV